MGLYQKAYALVHGPHNPGPAGLLRGTQRLLPYHLLPAIPGVPADPYAEDTLLLRGHHDRGGAEPSARGLLNRSLKDNPQPDRILRGAACAIIKGLDHIYEVEQPRNYILLRAMAVVYVVMLAVVLIAAAVLMVFGTTIYRAIQDRWPLVAALLINFKSLVSFVMLFFFFTLLYSFVPRRRVKLRHNLLGAVFGAGGWVLFSYFFSLFVENFSNFSIYGSLATLVIMMFWLFFCMYILFLGGEVSMWLEQSGVGEDIRNLLRGKPKRYKIRRSQTKATVEKEETE